MFPIRKLPQVSTWRVLISTILVSLFTFSCPILVIRGFTVRILKVHISTSMCEMPWLRSTSLLVTFTASHKVDIGHGVVPTKTVCNAPSSCAKSTSCMTWDLKMYVVVTRWWLLRCEPLTLASLMIVYSFTFVASLLLLHKTPSP